MMRSDRPYGIYIHIPFCRSKCDYCAFVSTPDFSLQKPYVSALVGEISGCGERGRAANTVYIGGGTPSTLFRGGITEIMQAVRSAFRILPNSEITVECNPESVDTGFIDECLSVGVNRISMGLQSSCDKVLASVGRVHSYDGFMRALKLLSKHFDNISSDLILGLPHQESIDVVNAVDALAELCSHLSVYALTVEEGTPLYYRGYSPNDDEVADMYDIACAKLREHGFSRYEVSNFCKNGKMSRHNRKYWNCEPYIGFGVAAHGYDGWRKRYSHGNDIASYIEDTHAEVAELSDKDFYNEYVMLRLRTESGICLDDFYNRFGFSFLDRNKNKLSVLQSAGSIVMNGETVAVAPGRMFVMNGIIEDLMLD